MGKVGKHKQNEKKKLKAGEKKHQNGIAPTHQCEWRNGTQAFVLQSQTFISLFLLCLDPTQQIHTHTHTHTYTHTYTRNHTETHTFSHPPTI